MRLLLQSEVSDLPRVQVKASGIIDLVNLKDESKATIEARPKDFFKLTYPTTDVIKVIEQINLSS